MAVLMEDLYKSWESKPETTAAVNSNLDWNRGSVWAVTRAILGYDLHESSPQDDPADQDWFITSDWKKREAEADEAIQNGDITTFVNGEEFLAGLDEDVDDDKT